MHRVGFTCAAALLGAALAIGCENMRKDKESGAGSTNTTASKQGDNATRAGKHGDAPSGSAAQGSGPSANVAASKTLYDRLGGEPAIRAVVGDFVDRSAADAKVNFTRAGTSKEWQATPESVQRLKDRLTEFVAQGTGGPQRYTGKQMREVHTGMKITNEEFNALAGHLKASLDKFNVPPKEQAELMAIIESTRKDVVGL
jgi:hemoglobin